MASSDKKTIAILNLTGELSEELVDYFARKSILIVDPIEDKATYDWTHILTKGTEDFNLIGETYKTLSKDIKIISLSHIDDLQDFVFANGKLIFDEVWLKNKLGEFILDKFFQEYGGIALGDNYPSFKEQGSFHVTNPFNTGEYLDRMVHYAFQSGMNGLALKTFFDHLIMFLTGLKTKGKLGLPIEITFGVFDDIFGVQLHFFTDNLMLEDVIACLSNNISKRTEEYLLNVAVQSSDFFDFTFLPEVKKSVITGLWTKDERIKFENRGMMFTHLSSEAPLTYYPTEGITSFLTENTNPADFSDKIILPEVPSGEGSAKISGTKFSEAVAERISENMEVEKIKQIITGNFQDDIFQDLIKGSHLPEDDAQVVKGDTEDEVKIRINSLNTMEEIVNLVKGKVEEEKDVFRISGGGGFDVDSFAYRITAGLSEKVKGDDVLKAKVLKQKLPETIKNGFFDFTRKLNKSIENLSEEDLENFKNIEIPKLIEVHTSVEESTFSVLTKDGQVQAKKFFDGFKKDLEATLKDEFQEDSVESLLNSLQNDKDGQKVKQVLKETLKRNLEEKFHLSQKNDIDDKEQEILVKTLTSTLAEDEEKIRTIVSNEKSDNTLAEVTPLFKTESSEDKRKLESQITVLTNENERLKSKIKTLLTEVKIVKGSKEQLAQAHQKAVQAAVEMSSPNLEDGDQALREHFQQKLKDQKILNEHDQKKLAELLERESKLLENAREEEMKAKRVQIEIGQKETYFAQELEKMNRQIKAKELAVTKTKDTLSKLVEKKDFELKDLHQKLDQLNKLLVSGQAQTQVKNIRELERQNTNYAKMLEVYKNKISSLASNIQKNNRTDDGGSKEEVRRLQMQNNQYKNQLDMAKKELSRFQEKASQDNTLIGTLKTEKTKLEQQLKKASFEAKKDETTNNSPALEQEVKRLESQAQLLDTQLKESQARSKDLEAKLVEMLKNQKKEVIQDEGSKVKVSQLENSVKKLTQDLVESRNQLAEMKKDTNKLRQEKTALQNQLNTMKKDLDKAKAATPKKHAGGKAA